MTVNGHRPTEAPFNDQRMAPAHAARRLVKTERLARELMQRREDIPRPLLAALLITLIEEAERRKRERG